MATNKDLIKKTPVTTVTPVQAQQANAQSAAQNQSTRQATQQTSSGVSAPSGASPVTGINYQQRLQELGGGSYTPSAAVQNANAYLQSILSSKPGAYQSNYTQQLNDLYNQIMNREAFSYDINGDALYQQYRDQFTLQGQNAMRDTMGQAAAMTGGYGSSYASTAGNQALQSYLQQLNDVVPELYAQAYQRYVQEGQDLKDKYGITQSADATDYGRYRDKVGDWQADRAYAYGAYSDERNFDYNDYATQLNKALTLLGMEQSDAQMGAQRAWNVEDMNTQRAWQVADMNTQRDWNVSDMNTQRDWQLSDMNTQRGWQLEDRDDQRKYDQYLTQDQRDYEQKQIADAREYEALLRQEGYSREDQQLMQQQAYSVVMSMLTSGVMPTPELLALAQIGEADALAFAKKNGYSTGGSSSKSNKSSGNDKQTVQEKVESKLNTNVSGSNYQKALDAVFGGNTLLDKLKNIIK